MKDNENWPRTAVGASAILQCPPDKTGKTKATPTNSIASLILYPKKIHMIRLLFDVHIYC